jgi:glucan 1,3-beta-glucosidase
MNRREFCKVATGAVMGASLISSSAGAAEVRGHAMLDKIRGVNLGSWLVLEKWMVPSLFAGLKAEDEYSFCQELGKEEAARRLKKHRETWITADDFEWLGAHGINTVRIPVGYWIAEENPPFITGLDTLDAAFGMAKNNGISVIVDLHGAPGSQNGWDHSGRAGEIKWPVGTENVEHTLRVIEGMAVHCKQYSNLLAIELLNEPRWDVPIDVLKNYYIEGYKRVRKSIPAEQAAVIIHDGFRLGEWKQFMPEPEYRNVILDTHIYQCYTDDDRKRDMRQQLEVAAGGHRKSLAEATLPVVVGEWSCALPPESTQGMSPFEARTAVRAYGATQLMAFEAVKGWIFWTYKLESMGGWNFRDCVKQGSMPDSYKA